MNTYSYKDSSGNTITVMGDYYRGIDLESGKRWDIWHDGKYHPLHNETGPAIIRDEDGNCEWFLDGIKYTKVQWLDKLGKK
jgi:hypothetical protein